MTLQPERRKSRLGGKDALPLTPKAAAMEIGHYPVSGYSKEKPSQTQGLGTSSVCHGTEEISMVRIRR
uniref:Uncharacterized protein n=1 Tax=Oryza punctata TaxID=4537 RepID=A0A0E0KYA9_ORYPU